MIKTAQQIQTIKDSGKYLNELLYLIYEKSKPGIALIELEFVAEDFLKKRWLRWAFKWYQWFPANLCLSINDCVVHWIPDWYILKNWDLLKIDCGVNYQWWITDSAISLVIWWEFANPLWHGLTKATKQWLDFAIKNIWPGIAMYEYSHGIYSFIHNAGFSILEKLTWHGVGTKVHEKPHIYNYPHPESKKIFFETGMVLAFEPITAVTSKDFVSRKWNDWNLYCKDGDLWAHWEYTIVITPNGFEILSWITENLWF